MASTKHKKGRFQRAMEHSVFGPILFVTIPTAIFMPAYHGVMLSINNS